MVDTEASTQQEVTSLNPEAQIAQIIGGKVTADRVHRVIQHSSGFLFHGTRGQIHLGAIKPLSPEGGFVSYWASGINLFIGGVRRGGIVSTYDTPFFHYASSPATEHPTRMTIAVIRKADLKEQGINTSGSPNYCTINKEVPQELIHYLKVEQPPQAATKGREAMRQLEQKMFDLIEDTVVKDQFHAGEITQR